MNAKEFELRRIMAIVVDCCSTLDNENKTSITTKDIIGKVRTENAVMSRCIFVSQAIKAGYSVSTVAFILKRTRQAIRYLKRLGDELRQTSRAYRIAEKEITLLCKDKSHSHERNDL